MSKIYTTLFALAFSLLLAAQDTTEKLLNEVIITANKYPKKQSETGKVVTVIDRQTIDQMGSRSLTEILNTVAGVNINGANNNLGTNQGVSIRGASFGNVLILIDGIPVNDPSVISNYFDLNFLNPDQIERIEILKGGQSTLYGSDAVAGVINIITKKIAADKFSPNVFFSAGSYNTFRGSAGVSGRMKKFGYNVQATAIKSKGFSSAYDSTGNANFDDDGYEQEIVRADLKYDFTNSFSVNVFGNFSKYNADLDAAAFSDDNDFFAKNKNLQTGAGFTWKQSFGNLVANYHFNHVRRYYLDDSTDKTNPYAYFSEATYIGRTHFAEVYQTARYKNFEGLLGVDYRENNTDQDYYSFGGFGPYAAPHLNATVKQISPYASMVFNTAGWNIELGGRWNNHNLYGNNFTYTFNPSYLINNKLKIFANAYSAFKAPSLYQLFDAFAGNQNLQPETSKVLEGGIELYATNKFRLRVTNFYRSTDNAIQYIIINPATFQSQYQNVNNQKNYGIETEVFYKDEKWNVHVNYTYTKGKINTKFSEGGFLLLKDTSYNNLYRVPQNAVNAFVGYNINSKIFVSTLIKFLGERLEPVYMMTPVQLNSYYTIDFSAGYNFNKNFRAFVDLKNITDKKYFDVLGYNTRRFNWSAGVSMNL